MEELLIDEIKKEVKNSIIQVCHKHGINTEQLSYKLEVTFEIEDKINL